MSESLVCDLAEEYKVALALLVAGERSEVQLELCGGECSLVVAGEHRLDAQVGAGGGLERFGLGEEGAGCDAHRADDGS
jgi:hypothetical protein